MHAAERRLVRDDDLYYVARNDGARHLTVVDTGEHAVNASAENQTARELRHRFHHHHFRREEIVGRAEERSFDRLLVAPPLRGRRAERDAVRKR